MVQRLDDSQNARMLGGALRRILRAEKAAKQGSANPARLKIIASLGAQSPPEMKTMLFNYIFSGIVKNMDLALSWLFEEYCFYQGFNRASTMLNRLAAFPSTYPNSKNNVLHFVLIFRGKDDSEYNEIVCQLIRGVMHFQGVEVEERELLLRR